MPAIEPLAETDEIITLIYQGPLEPKPWLSFLHCLRLRMDCDIAAMTLRPRRIGAGAITVWDRRPVAAGEDETRWDLEGFFARPVQFDPLGAALSRSGDILTLHEVVPGKELIHTDLYRNHMQPYGVEYMLGMRFVEPSGWKCNVGLMNGPKRKDFGKTEKEFFTAFRPHLERSLAVHARLQRNELEKEILEETLDRLNIGTLILDGEGKVIEANGIAQDIARRSSCISLVNDRIVLSNPRDDARLNRLVNEAIGRREKGHADTFVDVLRIQCPDGSNLDLLVRSVVTADRYRSDVSPSVIVYVADSGQQQLAPERILAQLFGLTPSEAFLASLLAIGFTLSDAAAKLDVTEGTARIYAKRIFAKTGVSRQADLVRLVLNSVASLA